MRNLYNLDQYFSFCLSEIIKKNPRPAKDGLHKAGKTKKHHTTRLTFRLNFFLRPTYISSISAVYSILPRRARARFPEQRLVIEPRHILHLFSAFVTGHLSGVFFSPQRVFVESSFGRKSGKTFNHFGLRFLELVLARLRELIKASLSSSQKKDEKKYAKLKSSSTFRD